MYTGKMTATWLILITIAGCLVVPMIIIYYHTILPQIKAHPQTPHFIIGMLPDIALNISIDDFVYNLLIQ